MFYLLYKKERLSIVQFCCIGHLVRIFRILVQKVSSFFLKFLKALLFWDYIGVILFRILWVFQWYRFRVENRRQFMQDSGAIDHPSILAVFSPIGLVCECGNFAMIIFGEFIGFLFK